MPLAVSQGQSPRGRGRILIWKVAFGKDPDPDPSQGPYNALRLIVGHLEDDYEFQYLPDVGKGDFECTFCIRMGTLHGVARGASIMDRNFTIPVDQIVQIYAKDGESENDLRLHLDLVKLANCVYVYYSFWFERAIPRVVTPPQLLDRGLYHFRSANEFF